MHGVGDLGDQIGGLTEGESPGAQAVGERGALNVFAHQETRPVRLAGVKDPFAR